MNDNSKLITLREQLVEWKDVDVAMYQLSVLFGVLPSDELFGGRKDLFWTNNALGNALYDLLCKLTEIGMLEHDEEEERFRWNQAYRLP